MPEPVFVIRNQHGLYLTRQNEWVDGHDAAPLFKAAFRDIALNTLIELNAKDIELRGTILEVEVNDKGLPRVTPAEAGCADISSTPDLVTVAEIAIDSDVADEEVKAEEVQLKEDEVARASADDIAPDEHSGS